MHLEGSKIEKFSSGENVPTQIVRSLFCEILGWGKNNQI